MNPSPRSVEDSIISFDYPIIEKSVLNRTNLKEHSNIFKSIVERRSNRNLEPINIESINKLLWYSAKAAHINIINNGYIISSRRAPSAGGRHPIDVIISLPKLQIQERTLSYYNPFDHSLNLLSTHREISIDFFYHINGILPIGNAAVIWFVAHPNRTSAKYENFESLIWRDAGALIYCFQLVSTALGLKTCPVGSLGEPYISKLFKEYGNVYGVGGLLIGK